MSKATRLTGCNELCGGGREAGGGEEGGGGEGNCQRVPVPHYWYYPAFIRSTYTLNLFAGLPLQLVPDVWTREQKLEVMAVMRDGGIVWRKERTVKCVGGRAGGEDDWGGETIDDEHDEEQSCARFLDGGRFRRESWHAYELAFAAAMPHLVDPQGGFRFGPPNSEELGLVPSNATTSAKIFEDEQRNHVSKRILHLPARYRLYWVASSVIQWHDLYQCKRLLEEAELAYSTKGSPEQTLILTEKQQYRHVFVTRLDNFWVAPHADLLGNGKRGQHLQEVLGEVVRPRLVDVKPSSFFDFDDALHAATTRSISLSTLGYDTTEPRARATRPYSYGCFVPADRDYLGGLNDQTALCSRKAADVYLGERLRLMGDFAGLEQLAFSQTYNNEVFLRDSLQRVGVPVSRYKAASFISCERPPRWPVSFLETVTKAREVEVSRVGGRGGFLFGMGDLAQWETSGEAWFAEAKQRWREKHEERHRSSKKWSEGGGAPMLDETSRSSGNESPDFSRKNGGRNDVREELSVRAAGTLYAARCEWSQTLKVFGKFADEGNDEGAAVRDVFLWERFKIRPWYVNHPRAGGREGSVRIGIRAAHLLHSTTKAAGDDANNGYHEGPPDGRPPSGIVEPPPRTTSVFGASSSKSHEPREPSASHDPRSSSSKSHVNHPRAGGREGISTRPGIGAMGSARPGARRLARHLANPAWQRSRFHHGIVVGYEKARRNALEELGLLVRDDTV